MLFEYFGTRVELGGFNVIGGSRAVSTAKIDRIFKPHPCLTGKLQCSESGRCGRSCGCSALRHGRQIKRDGFGLLF